MLKLNLQWDDEVQQFSVSNDILKDFIGKNNSNLKKGLIRYKYLCILAFLGQLPNLQQNKGLKSYLTFSFKFQESKIDMIFNSYRKLSKPSYKYSNLYHFFFQFNRMSQSIQSIVCLCGNDGTGKSTLISIFKQHYPSYAVIQRSSKQTNQILESLRKEIKHIDLLTYRYAFQNQRYDFQPSRFVKIQDKEVEVHWILLDLDPTTIAQRIKNRIQMGIYQSKKCVQYFSYVYLQLAAFYGMTVVDVRPTPLEVASHIVDMIQCGATRQIHSLNVKNMTMKRIMDSNLQNLIHKDLALAKTIKIIKEYLQPQIIQSEWQKSFYFPELKSFLYNQNQLNFQFASKLAAKWISNHSIFKNQDNQLTLRYHLGESQQSINIPSPIFVHFIEGESKQVYQVRSKLKQVQSYYSDRVWIILKSTIYSHTNQHTGQIQNLGKVRAVGSNLFLQMLRRNNLQHAYIAINNEGIIFSRKIQTNSIEVVFKREFVGTDKHSYFNLNSEPLLVNNNNNYKNGIYVRFDWRNPNHIITKYQNVTLNANPYYYLIQKYVGKEQFFKTFLQKEIVKPVGDKCISEDLIANYIDTQKIKKSVLSLYCSFAYYCKKVNLHIVDGCFMFNRDGSIVWSEINPDCMRVKYIQTSNQRVDYDKDIWRVGGSSSKDLIIKKWSLFNKLLIQYLLKNRFHQTQLLNLPPYHYPLSQTAQSLLNEKQVTWSRQYRKILSGLSCKTQKVKQVIGTIDISDGKPSLVKSSILSEHHSGDSLKSAFNYLKVMPKVVLVDLDAAMGKQTNNQKEIKKLTMNTSHNVYAVGGGIRSIQVLNYYLFVLCIPKIILSSNLDLLKQLPAEVIQQRIIVELSINQNNQILTHGRTVNTGVKVIDRMVELARLGVKIVSITFNHKQGHLAGIPREQLRDIMFAIPGPIKKIIIAGGITSVEDLQFIWGFPKAVPQLGSAIWKNKISLCDIITMIVNFNEDGLIPAIISNQTGKVLGQIYLDRQALQKSIQTRQLYRFSRKLNRLIKKGEQSGNTQKIESIYFDCDNDCLKIVLQHTNKPLCHNLTQSCFDIAQPAKIENLQALQKHIESKKQNGSGYSKKIQSNQHLAACKVIEQSRQLIASKDRHVQQGADLIAHLLMYFNAKNIPLCSFMQELNFRANKQKMIKEAKNQVSVITYKKPQNVEYIGVMGGKHFQKIDKAGQFLFGLRMIRPNNRSLKVQCAIQDQEKYDNYFKGVHLIPIGIKSKDMGIMLQKKYVKWCFNYSIMMDNYPKIWKELTKAPIPGIKLVLLKKKNKQVDPFTWTPKSKGKVVAQYPSSMINYLHSIGISEANYSLITVSGSTEGFLQMQQFDYCDAIVQSGKTVEDNHLQIIKVMCETIYGSLYTLE